MAADNAMIVFGSGPGVGRNVGAIFAEKGFSTVVLVSRNADRLKSDADFVRSASSKTTVHELTVDLDDTTGLPGSLKKVEELLKGKRLEAVLYNAARLGPSPFFDFKAEELERDLRISVVSLYAVAAWALPQLVASSTNASNTTGTPSFLVTSGMLSKDPAPAMFSLAACKAGQYNLTHSLYKEFEPKGVHCALIVIGGKVADASKVTNARNIAEKAYEVFEVKTGEGKLEVLLMDPAYLEHVKNRGK